jgi:biopolymer transport protein ExbD
MDPDSLRKLVAAPMVSLFAILILCVFVVQKPPSSGVLVPMMRNRAEPLTNCEFNGFAVYLRSDGMLGGGDREDQVSWGEMLSRVRDARDNIQDDTIFVIADPEVSYGQLARLVVDIHNTAPPDHIAVVTPAGQVEGFVGPSGKREVWADRCRFEWPALPGQPKWAQC